MTWSLHSNKRCQQTNVLLSMQYYKYMIILVNDVLQGDTFKISLLFYFPSFTEA